MLVLKGKIDPSFWERASQKEKNKAYLFSWFSLIATLAIFFIALYWLFIKGQVEVDSLTNLDLWAKIVLFILILIVLFFPIARGTAIIFEMKNIRGKFGIESLFLIVLVLPTSGLNLLVAPLLSNSIRKQIIRNTRPKFEGSEKQIEDKPIEKDKTKALYCLSDAIKLENAGKYKEAYNKYREAYFLGDGRGAYYLARMYEEGKGIRKSIDESLKWERKAADSDVSLSQYYIGIELINGKNISKNETLGMSYLERSALQNEFDACFYLGIKHGSDMNEKYFDLKKAEEYLLRAIKGAENDEEVGQALNELGRIWIGLWGETNELEHFKIALQLFKKAKSYDNEDAIDNYIKALSIMPKDYPQENELMRDWVVDSYLNSNTFEKGNVEEVDEERDELAENLDERTEEQVINNKTNNTEYNQEIEELKSLRTGLIISSIIKLVCFGVGLFLVLYGYNNGDNLFILTPIVIIGGVVVAGLPGLPKAFNDSYNYNKKWDKFFRTPEYKATINYDKRTVTVKKNDDWLSIIFITLMNLIKTAMAAPFEVIRDVWRIFTINGKIKEYSK